MYHLDNVKRFKILHYIKIFFYFKLLFTYPSSVSSYIRYEHSDIYYSCYYVSSMNLLNTRYKHPSKTEQRKEEQANEDVESR